MCSDKCCEKDKCRITVTVEDDFAPCAFPENCFDIEIRSRDGCDCVCGKVTGGSSAVFELPCKDCHKDKDCDCDCDCGCGKDYSVTVTGGVYSSPHAQTRRVRCWPGVPAAGLTFIFMTYEPCCEPECCEPECCPPPCCCEPCKPCKPCKPPKPPKPHKDEDGGERPPEPPCDHKPPKPHKPQKEQECECESVTSAEEN